MDTIKVGTKEEKFNNMKEQLVLKGRWNTETERNLRNTLEFHETAPVEKTVEEIVNLPKPKATRKATRKGKKK